MKLMVPEGNIGAAERGLPFLEEEGLIPEILDIAERSLVLSVRGCVPSTLHEHASLTLL